MQKKKAPDSSAEIQELRARLQEAEDTLEAIRTGKVDGLVVSTPKGDQIYTISGAEKPYRVLIEEMKEGAVIVSEDNKVLYCNKGFAKILKRSIEKIIGENISNVVSPNHLDGFEELMTSGRLGKGVMSKEIGLKADDNTFVPTQISINSLITDDVKTTFLVVTDLSQHMEEDVKRYTANLEEEINQRKKAQESVRISERRFKSLAENAPDVIMRFDANLRIMYLNPQVEIATGISADLYVGKTNEEMGMPDDLVKMWNELFHRSAKSKKAQEAEFIFPSPNGNRAYDLRVVPEYAEDGSFTSFLGISRDITERKKAEEALHEAQVKIQDYATNLEKLVEERTKQLHDAERLAAIGATAGMVGHDIRNPLQSIASDAYLAKADLALMPEGEAKEGMKESLAGIEKNVEYINKIVADLQDFARPIQPVAQETDIESLCNDVLFKNVFPESIDASCQVDEQAKILISDSALLKRILSNLVNNAFQAMPQGGKLAVQAYKEKGDTIITVQDTGVGIPEEIRPKLFTPLFTTKSRGQGFGLAVVKRMTDALGGTITFESEVGKGTKFIVRFPPKN